jgi:hypothetical protein
MSRAALLPPVDTAAPSTNGDADGIVVVVVVVDVVDVVVVVEVDVVGTTVVVVVDVVVVEGTFVVGVAFLAVVVGAAVVVVSATVVVVVSRAVLRERPTSTNTRSSAGGSSALTWLSTNSGCKVCATSLNPRSPAVLSVLSSPFLRTVCVVISLSPVCETTTYFSPSASFGDPSVRGC